LGNRGGRAPLRGIGSGRLREDPRDGGGARSGRQCSRPYNSLRSMAQLGRCALAARLAPRRAGIPPRTAGARSEAPPPRGFFTPPPQAQSPGAAPAATRNLRSGNAGRCEREHGTSPGVFSFEPRSPTLFRSRARNGKRHWAPWCWRDFAGRRSMIFLSGRLPQSTRGASRRAERPGD
jgi:hypothetical protein